ncbi:MAG: hypothetical protein HOV79_12115 [Hamadaea sp.]|nr:hypothetical protein [Hamadaea sp.]
MLRKNLARLLVVTAATLGIALGSVAPASAHYATWGWGDNDQLCQVSSCINTGNLVAMWQTILYADQLLEVEDIDGQFGPQTATETINWQRLYNGTRPAGKPAIDADGWVGTQSWTAAEYDRVYETYDATYNYYHYTGVNGWRVVNLKMNKSTGVWYFQKPNSMTWYITSHGS